MKNPLLAIGDFRSKSAVMDVITLTGNLLAEWTFEIPAMERGKTHRADGLSFQVGGKGINVSRILSRLGNTTQSVAFADGHMGAFCSEWLESRAIQHKFFPLGASPRPGLVARETGKEGAETTFLGLDVEVSPASWKAACQFIQESRPKWLAICGSIPGWRSTWKKAVAQIANTPAGIRICVDTYGPPLKDLIELPLELVKINRTELTRLRPETADLPPEAAIATLRKDSPVKNWIITDGAEAVMTSYATGDCLLMKPASVREISSTGSGDTFLAALLHEWSKDSDPRTMLSFAAGCATANAASPNIGDFPLPLPERFLPAFQ